MKLSVLDLVHVSEGQSPAEALRGAVPLAQAAEQAGYHRVWYAEHHNFRSIASSAPAVIIAHVAAHTTRIRLGSGGVMLPNHAPLTVAEQFGTLEAFAPGRIDLGLGRAPGTDPITLGALRRTPGAAERFPEDVRELLGYLSGDPLQPGVLAVPTAGASLPVFILGSSMFGAELAARLGLPYAFASQFTSSGLDAAVSRYREAFVPSERLDAPYAVAGMNVFVHEDPEEAAREVIRAKRARVRGMFSRPGQDIDDALADRILADPRGAHIHAMLTHSAVGTADQAATQLREFASAHPIDEVMVAPQGSTLGLRIGSLRLLAEGMRQAG